MAYFDLHPVTAASAITGELVVVIPIYNEKENIRNLVSDWTKQMLSLSISYSLLLINDGSRDNTLEVLRELEKENPERVVVVNKSNSGHGRSCRFGYDMACVSGAEWVLQIDSDGQCDPAYFREFWEKRNESDCVFGLRVQRDDGRLRRWTSQCCRLGSSFLCGVDLRDPNVPYRLMRKEVLKAALASIPSDFNIHNVALTYVLKKRHNLRWSYVPIIFRDRQGDSNSIDVGRVMQWGVDMLFELRRLKK